MHGVTSARSSLVPIQELGAEVLKSLLDCSLWF